MKWTKEEDEKLLKLIKECTYYEELGGLLGKTSNSVRLRANRLGVKIKNFIVSDIEKECPFCKKLFTSRKSQNKRFCNNSCSALFNNPLNGKKRSLRPNKYKICLNCDKELKSNSTFCNNTCYSQYKTTELFNLIEAGDTSFHERRYKQYLIHKFGNKCMECNWCKINPTTNKVPIQLEHIDGKYKNNSLENLMLLCPNCHSLTSTYGSLNRGNGREGRKEWRLKNKSGEAA